jgi:3-oxoacyl-[acyl-carrier-protein] synthase-3
MLRSRVIGCGAYLPAKILTNKDLEKTLDTTGEWIEDRTGIQERHIAADGELTSDLARQAAEVALKNSGVKANEVDLIILATTTPDSTFPATAVKVQAQLGAGTIPAFDVQAVCSGFIYALATADNFIRAGQTKTALVIGAEVFSRIVDWKDRGTAILFGDGAGAVVLRATEVKNPKADAHILSTHLHADGRQHDMLYVDGGAGQGERVGKVKMQGKEVFKHAVLNLASVVDEALAANDLQPKDLSWLIPHQANKRIISAMAERLNLSTDKVVQTIAKHGNTSAASIPLAWYAAIQDGRVKAGDLLLLQAMGGGFTWGAGLIRF